MTSIYCKPLSRTGLVLACCFWLAGCAGPLGLFGSRDSAPPFRDPAMSMQAASDVVMAGKTSKAEVLAALGPGVVVKFNSGFEVWAYRQKPAGAAASSAEFVVLFAPSGIVQKTRIRPSYAVHEE
ncbi:hypothetical protein [Polaromonas sp.]|uniref:hypothetical protein n=1 Tax=Polaromonas sp. TaxID=1869339 RepID=UPI00286AD661|nr:hypothetical protein [Polaromonas sp.]